MKVLTIDDLIKDLKALKKEHGNLPIVYSQDDEGNGYQFVAYNAGPMYFKKPNVANYVRAGRLDDPLLIEDGSPLPANALKVACIN